jgi:molecular chaperone GrpE
MITKDKKEKVNPQKAEQQENGNLPEEKESTGVSGEKDELEIARKKISGLEEQLRELQDKLLRKAAEFENYKRRVENDQFNLLTYGAESFIVKLLPVVDDFERSLRHIDNTNNSKSIEEGVKLVYEKLLKVLDEQGVKKIEAVGSPFNVDFHDALMQRKDDTVKPHTVLEEIEPGYIYRDKVIRHAKVIVSEDIAEEDSAQGKNDSEQETT